MPIESGAGQAVTGTAEATGTSVSSTIPITPNPEPAPGQKKEFDITTIIPEEYKNKPYIQNIKSAEDFFKQFDNAQQLIGKKTIGVPDENATEEDWEKFRQALRPEKPEDYAFETKPLGEGYELFDKQVEEMMTPAFKSGLQNIFHKRGLDKQTAAGIVEDYNKLFFTEHKAMVDEANNHRMQQDKLFDDLSAKHFGANKDQAVEQASKIVTSVIPEDVKGLLPLIPAEALVVLGSALLAQQKKYGVEDKPVGSVAQGQSIEHKETEYKKIIASDAFKNWMHPEYQATRSKAEALASEITKQKYYGS